MKAWMKSIKTAWVWLGNRIICAPLRRWQAWRQRRKTLRILRRMDAHQLKDIGLNAHDIDRFH